MRKVICLAIIIDLIMAFMWALTVGCIVTSDRSESRITESIIKIRNEEQNQYVQDYREKMFWAENGVIIDIWDNWGGDTLDYIDITKFDYDKNSGRIYYLANYCVYGAVKYKSLYVYDLRTNELTNLHHDWQADR